MLSFLCTHPQLEIRAILLSRPSATLVFSVSTLSYTAPSLFISLCTPSYEPCRHNLSSRPIHILVDHYRFSHSLGSSTTYLSAFFYVYPSITWPQQYDSQSRPRRGFPVTILLTGLSVPLPHLTSSANPFTISCSRQPAWGGARPSPSFSPSPNNARLPNGPAPATTQAVSFPPLGPSSPAPRQDHKLILQNLAGLTVRLIYR